MSKLDRKSKGIGCYSYLSNYLLHLMKNGLDIFLFSIFGRCIEFIYKGQFKYQ